MLRSKTSNTVFYTTVVRDNLHFFCDIGKNQLELQVRQIMYDNIHIYSPAVLYRVLYGL